MKGGWREEVRRPIQERRTVSAESLSEKTSVTVRRNGWRSGDRGREERLDYRAVNVRAACVFELVSEIRRVCQVFCSQYRASEDVYILPENICKLQPSSFIISFFSCSGFSKIAPLSSFWNWEDREHHRIPSYTSWWTLFIFPLRRYVQIPFGSIKIHGCLIVKNEETD